MDSGATLEELEQRPDYEVQLESLNQWQLAWKRFKRHRLAVIGSAIFLSIVAIAIVGPVLAHYDFRVIPTVNQQIYAGRAPSWVSGNWNPPLLMGETARLQRDVFILVINGARLSLII